ncbi:MULTISPECIES: peptidase inhibitor family I36 protein [Streptomyces]|uniref:peptidase inhibitor family I36 protein n=1 Tax=Streptomyces TaxID=1883 RepID=UPI0028892DF4|nr:peptidase inhibitor family I36 protein [Streptomyces sp. DSM 41529]
MNVLSRRLVAAAPTRPRGSRRRAGGHQVGRGRLPRRLRVHRPEIDFGGQPWAKRVVDGSVKDLPSTIRDRGSSVRNNSDGTARVYERRNFAGRWVCVTRSGGSIHDLRGYNRNDRTRSLCINRNDCG